MSRFARAPYSRSHLSDRNTTRRLETPPDEIACAGGVRAFRSVIGLLRPGRFILLDQLHTVSFDYLQLTAAGAEGDQGCPPGVGLHPERDVHRSPRSYSATGIAGFQATSHR